ncbi:MAG: BrnT family toxin [Alphaproteobacteria bacterium]|nr:BrnT family toxin [Alphaproteobacteria bacterium]
MQFEWDENKNAANVAKHKLSFAEAWDFPWHESVLFDRSREDDGEKRYAAIGRLHGKLHTIIFTKRAKRVRIITLRRANKSEETAYEKAN